MSANTVVVGNCPTCTAYPTQYIAAEGGETTYRFVRSTPSPNTPAGGAVAFIAPFDLESLNACRNDTHNGYVHAYMRPDDVRTLPLYTQPPSTVSADAVLALVGKWRADAAELLDNARKASVRGDAEAAGCSFDAARDAQRHADELAQLLGDTHA